MEWISTHLIVSLLILLNVFAVLSFSVLVNIDKGINNIYRDIGQLIETISDRLNDTIETIEDIQRSEFNSLNYNIEQINDEINQVKKSIDDSSFDQRRLLEQLHQDNLFGD